MGDVWLCCEQSNRAPRRHNQSYCEYRSANSPMVHHTYLESQISAEPADELGAREKWMSLVDGVLEERQIGPAAYYFGARLQRFLKVPIVIHDLGADAMHPSRKRDVGERAARWALAHPVISGGKLYLREQDKLMC